MTKQQVGEERVYWAYTSTLLFITKESQDRNSSKAGDDAKNPLVEDATRTERCKAGMEWMEPYISGCSAGLAAMPDHNQYLIYPVVTLSSQR